MNDRIPVTRRFDVGPDATGQWWGSLYVIEPNVVGVVSDAGNFIADACPAKDEAMLAFVARLHVDSLAQRLTRDMSNRGARSLAIERLRRVLPRLLPLVVAAHQAAQTRDLPVQVTP